MGLVTSVHAAMQRAPVRQAGGIVVRVDADGPRVLVVSAQHHRKRWVLPKGSVERGETAAEAALREVWEEAGVRGAIVARAGRTEYEDADGRFRVEYFLVAAERVRAASAEGRRRRWCTVDGAAALLEDLGTRSVLLAAAPRIARLERRAMP